MNRFDRDTAWADAKSMSLCVCGDREKSHRPISRKCSICNCQEFKPQKPGDKPASTAALS